MKTSEKLGKNNKHIDKVKQDVEKLKANENKKVLEQKIEKIENSNQIDVLKREVEKLKAIENK